MDRTLVRKLLPLSGTFLSSILPMGFVLYVGSLACLFLETSFMEKKVPEHAPVLIVQGVQGPTATQTVARLLDVLRHHPMVRDIHLMTNHQDPPHGQTLFFWLSPTSLKPEALRYVLRTVKSLGFQSLIRLKTPRALMHETPTGTRLPSICAGLLVLGLFFSILWTLMMRHGSTVHLLCILGAHTTQLVSQICLYVLRVWGCTMFIALLLFSGTVLCLLSQDVLPALHTGTLSWILCTLGTLALCVALGTALLFIRSVRHHPQVFSRAIRETPAPL